ncbi:MAG: hypothetical protein H0W63_03775 [Gemmatimonadaceae bacterium]|nr:hypothetical protein [Gemmatimonadaceae bacterium]
MKSHRSIRHQPREAVTVSPAGLPAPGAAKDSARRGHRQRAARTFGALRLPAAVVMSIAMCACWVSIQRPDAEVRTELLEMYARDQKVREGFGPAAAANDTMYGKRMVALDSIHTARLKKIVSKSGWPGRSRVGENAAHAAWILLQHSADRAFQKLMLAELLLEKSKNEVAPSELAMLTDRIRTEDGLKQLYGTRFDIVDGVLVLFPIEDEQNLEQRRTAAGLPPMKEYIKQAERMTGLNFRPKKN